GDVAPPAATAPAEPAAPSAPRVAVLSSRPSHASVSTSNSAASAPKRAAISRVHVARPSVQRNRPQVSHKHKASKPVKAPALDPEVHSAAASTVWLNRAAPDPTPPAARLKLTFARELVSF